MGQRSILQSLKASIPTLPSDRQSLLLNTDLQRRRLLLSSLEIMLYKLHY